MLKPILENGETASGDAVVVGHDTVTARIESGRYELVDVSAQKRVDAARMPVTRDDQDAYIRFGGIPDGERSRNHADGHAEAGVSVYTARIVGVPPGSELPGVYTPAEARAPELASLVASRDAYLVTGREVGTGSDGEPVLRDVEVVCDLVLADPGDDDPASDVFGFVPA